jgi:hypothetical protein
MSGDPVSAASASGDSGAGDPGGLLGAHSHVALGPVDHVGQAVGLQMGPDGLAYVRPDGKENALSLVVARTVCVRLAEVTGGDRAVDGGDDLGQADLFGESGQDVPASNAAFGANQARSFEGEEDLFKIGLGESGPLGDVPHRRGIFTSVQRERQQRTAGIVTTRRDSHALMLPSDGQGRVVFGS